MIPFGWVETEGCAGFLIVEVSLTISEDAGRESRVCELVVEDCDFDVGLEFEREAAGDVDELVSSHPSS